MYLCKTIKWSENKFLALKKFSVRSKHSSSSKWIVFKENDMVVIEGNFLLDAQAQLFGGYEDMNNDKDPMVQSHH